MVARIDELKNEITLTFMRTQNLIISSYFDKAFENITSLEQVELYRRKLYSFKDYLGCTEGYTFFNDYYVHQMEKLEQKYIALENGEVVTALKVITQKENMFFAIFKAIKKLIFANNNKDEKIKE